MHRNFEMSLGLNIITISNFILRSVENLNIHFFNEIFKQYRGNLIINRVTTFYTLWEKNYKGKTIVILRANVETPSSNKAWPLVSWDINIQRVTDPFSTAQR